MELFPYPPRKHQQEFVELVARGMNNGAHLIVESGTGTGKTVCSLAGTLEAAKKSGMKVVYLTRTNSQQRQVILELRKIKEKADVYGLGLQGRQSACPLIRRDPELKGGSSEELSRLCAEKKKRTLADKAGGCRFYQEVLTTNFEEIEAHCRATIPTVEEFVEYCDERGLCPYELSKELLASADVVTAPYPYLFIPFIRSSFLERLNAALSETLVIVDEAHNMPEYARDIKSAELSRHLLELVRHEVDEYGDPEVIDGASILDIVDQLSKLLDTALAEYLVDDDGLIPPDYIEAGLMEAFSTTSRSIAIAAKALMTHGEIIQEKRKDEGRLPRSFIFSLGGFIAFWMNMEEEYYVKLIVGGENPRFEASCLDPSLACAFFHECGGTLHMSGTLAPLYEYRDSIGLPSDAIMQIFPSPFPKENRRIFFVDDVTTKYEELAQDQSIVPRMEDHMVSIVNLMDRNAVVFFPSYGLMERFLADGVLHRIKRKVHLEERGMPQAELMDTVARFKKGSGNGEVLFAVMGGRISEGIDFPDKELQVAILAGVPYPKPTAKQRALLHYYELKFGRGWEYTVKVPATRKMLQAIGRLIRTETDVGAAVILDKRARQFADRIEVLESQAPPNDLLAFFHERNA
jgi:DNA excision repair protein ERCC-2